MNHLRTPAAILLALLLLSAPLGAQDPAPVAVLKLSAPATVNVGDLATVSVDPSSNVQDVQFVCVPMPTNPSNWAPHGDFAELVCGADCPEGDTFTIVAAANLNGKTVTATTTVTFVVPEPPPPPVPPGPGPNPPAPTPPPVPPVASKLWVVTVDDASQRTQETAAVLNDPTFWPALRAAGHKFRDYDKANPEAAQFAKFIPATVTGPAILFMDQTNGKVLEADALPADVQGIAAIVAKLTGSKIGGDE